MKKTLLILIFIFLFSTNISFASKLSPIDTVEKSANQIISILRSKEFKNNGNKNSQLKKILPIITEAFDFDLIGKLALGSKRKLFKKNQMDEFSKLFTKLLINTYFAKIHNAYKNEKIKFLKQDIFNANKAIVKTKIIRQPSDLNINYKVRLKNDNWKIYDVNIEGVSLVSNYRNQFNNFFANNSNSPDKLIQLLENKLNKIK